MMPSRFLVTPQVRALHGSRVDEFGAALLRSDVLADDVVLAFRALPHGQGWAQLQRALLGDRTSLHPAIATFVDSASTTPTWVDREAVTSAGALLLRAGPLGGMVLGLSSLPTGYASPAGNKPLAFSGRLQEQAPRRLMETARFVHAVCSPDGMRPGGEGFQATLKVRLMHAQVRRLLWDSGRWNTDAWGLPINQHDLVATTLLFSIVLLNGLRTFGLEISTREAEAYIHLWRYVGWLMGAEPALLPATEADAFRIGDLIQLTQGEPDGDSRALTDALLRWRLKAAKTPWERRLAEASLPFARAGAHLLLGRRLATQLGVERSLAELGMPMLRRTLSGMERVRLVSSRVHAFAIQRGDEAWRRVVEQGLEGVPAEFRPPSSLSDRRA